MESYLNIQNYMMNSSNGFQGAMGTSKGFRTLNRPASGMLKRAEFLRTIDISQSEQATTAIINTELAGIQQEINLFDPDKKYRQSEGGLQKGYATAFRKWLRAGNAAKEEDPVKVLKQMGVESYEAGFRKLWKLSCNLDLMVSKITDLQIIHFLVYDQLFGEICNDSQRSAALLSSIANTTYNPATFQVTQVILDRFKDLFTATRRGTNTAKKDERREETGELIAQLRSENAKLTGLLEQLSTEREAEKKRELEKEKENSRAKEQPKPTTTVLSEHSSPKAAFREIQEKYQDQLRYLTSEKARADEAVVELKVKIATLEAQIKSDAELFKKPTGPAPKSGSYEEALMQQMEKMKKGFQRKIAVMTEEFSTRQRELRKKEAEYKSENEKIKWEKSLLLKKFELIPQK